MSESPQKGIDERLRHHLNEFKPAERKIAIYLLNDYPMAGLVSITELSAKCEVSTPTVMRTLKRIGFTSFVDFQKALKKELSAVLADPIEKHTRWATGAPNEHILNQGAEALVSNLGNTMKQISHKTFDDVVDLLCAADCSVYLVGGRITHSFSDYLATHLEVIRNRVYKLPAAVSLWSHQLLNMRDGDVLVVFDVRRYEEDLLSFAELASKKGILIVLFTDQWMSPVSRFASHNFPVHVEAPSGWDSGMMMLFIVEALISEVERRLWPDVSQRMRELEGFFDYTGRFRVHE